MRFYFWILLLLPFFLTLEAKQDKVVRIALIVDGKSKRIEQFEEEFKFEIADLLSPEFEVIFLEEGYEGDWTPKSVQMLIDQALVDRKVDVVVAMGAIGSDYVSKKKELPKPTFAPFVVDPKIQGLPYNSEEESSGIKNLNYLTFPSSIFRDLKLFKELSGFQNIAFLTDQATIEAFPELMNALLQVGKELGLNLEVIPAKGSAEELLEKIPESTEAVYIASLPRFNQEEVRKLSEGLIEECLPSFTLFGRDYIDQGILVSMAPDSDLDRLSRRVALNIQAALLGQDPGSFSILISEGQQLTVNSKTASDLGISLPWDVLVGARLVDEDKIDRGPKLTLVEAVEEGLSLNTSLAAVWREVAAGLEDLRRAQARLRPQVEVSSLARLIDRDRAKARLGFEPQAAIFGTATAEQVLYSNELFGDVRVQRYLQMGRCENYQTSRLDLIFEVTRSYLNLLRAETLERIQRNNLKLTQSNLRTAEQRVRVGVARLSEVYRWESQLSDDKSSVVDAYFQTQSQQVILSRLLNSPQRLHFNLVDISLDEPIWMRKRERVEELVDTPQKLELFARFSIIEGFQLSPELREVTDRVAAQAEVLGIANRAFWQPDFFLFGEVKDRFTSGGAGRRLPPGVNTTEWVTGINMFFPLYEGGAKCANKRQAYQNLMRLRFEFTSLAERIEQDIRVNINQATSSYAAIGLAESAAESARKNLELVKAGYAKGTETILDLLDAQNQSLNSDLLAANALYDFLIDSAAVQRAIGRFDFLMDKEEQEKWVRCLEKFMEEHV